MRERTHIAIADDAPFLSTRKLVTSSGETFDKLLLHTKRVSRELELPRQGMWDVLLRLTKQTVPLSTLDHSLLKDYGEDGGHDIIWRGHIPSARKIFSRRVAGINVCPGTRSANLRWCFRFPLGAVELWGCPPSRAASSSSGSGSNSSPSGAGAVWGCCSSMSEASWSSSSSSISIWS
jgi:hypothetical protein